jgi:hypothetical protein
MLGYAGRKNLVTVSVVEDTYLPSQVQLHFYLHNKWLLPEDQGHKPGALKDKVVT